MNHDIRKNASSPHRALGAQWIGRVAVVLICLLLASPALVGGARAAQCAGGMSVRVMLGGCEVSISGLTSPDGTTLTAPTLGLRVAGVACTYEPFGATTGIGDLIKCFARMLQPFVQVECK